MFLILCTHDVPRCLEVRCTLTLGTYIYILELAKTTDKDDVCKNAYNANNVHITENIKFSTQTQPGNSRRTILCVAEVQLCGALCRDKMLMRASGEGRKVHRTHSRLHTSSFSMLAEIGTVEFKNTHKTPHSALSNHTHTRYNFNLIKCVMILFFGKRDGNVFLLRSFVNLFIL